MLVARTGVTCSVVTLLEFFQAPKYRVMRAAMFAGLGLWGLVPAVHGWMLSYDILIVRQAVALDVLMGVVYLVRLQGCTIVLGCFGTKHSTRTGQR